jgi:polysaccharide deacetylase family protein (PEP-CTERM system associated)
MSREANSTMSPEVPLRHVLSFDVEDWHQIVEWKLTGRRPSCSDHVIRQTAEILELLALRGVRATFFILGLVAEAHPTLVRQIQGAGHEVGCHGWSHALIYRQTPGVFEAETIRAKALIEDIIGAPTLGYRAAEFSITTASRWALEILVRCGFAYDSSIFPVAGERYGIPDTPLDAHAIETPAGPIRELPMSVLDWRGRRFGFGGGGYFRLLPYAVTRAGFRAHDAAGRPAITYFHPYEFSSQLLVPRGVGLAGLVTGSRYVAFHNFNRRRNWRRLGRLLQDNRFGTAAEVLNLG